VRACKSSFPSTAAATPAYSAAAATVDGDEEGKKVEVPLLPAGSPQPIKPKKGPPGDVIRAKGGEEG
jgi:hypothetical protein